MNQFFVSAVTEKVSALKTEWCFKYRQARGESTYFDVWLAASTNVESIAGDELTMRWLELLTCD